MPDPLSLVTGVIALLTFGTKVGKEIKGISHSVQGAQTECQRIESEISALCGTLARLETVLQDDFGSISPFPEDSTAGLKDVLDNCMGIFIQLSLMVKSVTRSEEDGVFTKGVKKLRWATSVDGDIAKLRGALEAHKSALNLTLALATNLATYNVASKQDAIRSDMSDIRIQLDKVQGVIGRLELNDNEALSSNSTSDLSSSVLREFLATTEQDTVSAYSDGGRARDGPGNYTRTVLVRILLTAHIARSPSQASRTNQVGDTHLECVHQSDTGLPDHIIAADAEFDHLAEKDKVLQLDQLEPDRKEDAVREHYIKLLAAVRDLAIGLSKKGEHDKALWWYRRVLEGREEVFGKNHPKTLTTVTDIAVLLKQQKKYKTALQWFQRALEGSEEVFGMNHRKTLFIICDIGDIFEDGKEYEKALKLYQWILDGGEEPYGKNHPGIFTIMGRMATILTNQEEYKKALQLYQRALDGEVEVLGECHPDTLSTINHMARTFRLQGDYAKALQWYQQCLNTRREVLGDDHPDTLRTSLRLAFTFKRQKQYEEALQWYQYTLRWKEKVNGDNHSATIAIVLHIAKLFDCQKQYDNAIQWYTRAFKRKEKALGKHHPDTLKVVDNLTKVFCKKHEYDEKNRRKDLEKGSS